MWKPPGHRTILPHPSWCLWGEPLQCGNESCLAEAWTREAEILFGIGKHAPSLAFNLPKRTNDSGTKGVPALCVLTSPSSWGRLWFYLASFKQLETHCWEPQCGHSKKDVTKTPEQLNHQNHHRTRIHKHIQTKLQLLRSDTKMDMPGKDTEDAASILCRLLEQSTMTETFTGPQQPSISYSQSPTPPQILNLHRKQQTSLFNITFHSNRSVISQWWEEKVRPLIIIIKK